MTQRVRVLLIAAALAMPVLARAQTAKHPDFNGSWRITNIDMPEVAAGGYGGGGNRGGYGGRGGFGGTGDPTAKSKTRWEGVALVTDLTRSMNTPRGNFDMKSREVRSLSDDGRAMTVRMELDTPRGKQAMTVTYDKVAD